MGTRIHPRLLNGPSGDPAVLVAAPHAVLFDCGDLSALSTRDLLRVDALCVSHAHMDHWSDFDRLLRPLIGREATLRVVGPPGFADRLHHRLASYTWNLVDRIPADLVVEVTEVHPTALPRTCFRLRTGFAAEPLPHAVPEPDGTVLRLGALRLRAALLDHGTPSVGFALAEDAQLNIRRAMLDDRGLPVGAWLAALKDAVAAGRRDDHMIAVGDGAAMRPLGTLRDLVGITQGQRIAYLTDVAVTPANRATAIALARDADKLFIEAPFLAEDASLAADRMHLTTTAAGEIARAAGVRRVEPFHLSPRYLGQEARWMAEIAAAFGGAVGPA